jgi:hypothetical protein
VPRIRVEPPEDLIELLRASVDPPMLCRYGCPLPVYPGFGCCRGCVTKDEPRSVPWLKCEGCRRAVDVLLGDLATDEDRLCPMCRDENTIEVLKDGKTVGFAKTYRETMRLVHEAGKSIFRLGAYELENRSEALRLRGTWKSVRAIGAWVSYEPEDTDADGNGTVLVHFEMYVKSNDGKFRGQYECDVACEVIDEDRLCEVCRKREKVR